VQFDLLTLPFIGGYVFYTRFSYTAYGAVRAVGQHLLLRSALCGFFLLIVARLLLIGAPYVEKQGDYFLATSMCAIPGLGIVAGAALFVCVQEDFKERAVAMLRTPRAIVLILASLGLFVIAIQTARAAPNVSTWLLGGVVSWSLVALAAWILSSHTATPFKLATFRSAWFLLILLLVVAMSAARGDDISHIWPTFSPFKDSGAPALALMIGITAWYPLNLLIPFKAGLERFHRLGNSDAMDRFLFDVAEASVFIQLTLTDGKFYIGKIKSLAANPLAPNSFVRILPYASGYRNKDSKELVFTSFYEDVYDELINEPGFTEDKLDQFIKVLPFGAIFSANQFDPDMYIRFKREDSPEERSSSEGELAGG
jgi:hypothetical protein